MMKDKILLKLLTEKLITRCNVEHQSDWKKNADEIRLTCSYMLRFFYLGRETRAHERHIINDSYDMNNIYLTYIFAEIVVII